MLNNTSVNKVMLMGRIGAEPNIQLVDGQNILSFPIVTTEKIRKSGEVEVHEEWHQVRVNARLINQRDILKGKMVYLQGRLQTKQVVDEHHVKHYKAEVIAYSVEPIEVQLKVV